MPSKKRYLIYVGGKVYLTPLKALKAMGYQHSMPNPVPKWKDVARQFSIGRWIVSIRDKSHLKDSRRGWIRLRQELEPVPVKPVEVKPKDRRIDVVQDIIQEASRQAGHTGFQRAEVTVPTPPPLPVGRRMEWDESIRGYIYTRTQPAVTPEPLSPENQAVLDVPFGGPDDESDEL